MQRREFLGHVVRTAVAGGAVLVTRRGWATATETAGSAIAGSARRASVVDFGADPTGVKDSTAAVQRAIASLARRNARLVFPAGKYTFAASDAVLMEFHGYEGLEIFGNGAELSFSGATRPVLINRCKDLEVHDIIVDWARPPFSQGTIKSISDRTVTVAVDPAYPVDGSERVQTIAALASRRSAAPLATPAVQPSATTARMRGTQMLELDLTEHAPFREGTSVVLLHPGAAQPALHLQGCDQVLLETVIFHTAPGAAILVEGCRDITLDTLRVIPHPGSGRLISTGGGGVELIDCTGTVTAEHAMLHGTGGAALRVQQSYWTVTELLDPQIALVASPDGRPVPEWLLPKQGTYIQLSEGGSLKLLGEIALAKAASTPGGMKLSFEESLSPSIVKGTMLCLSATNQPQLKLDECQFKGGMREGLVAQSRVRINSSSFSGYAGPAILLAPDAEHGRGPVVENIHITDCTFEQCNNMKPRLRGAVTIDTEAEPREANATPAHRINEGITIERNTFRQLGGPAIYCAGSAWLDVESNRFQDCDLSRAEGATPAAIVLRNVDESTITLNEASTSAKIVMIGCTEKVKVGDNTALTPATG
jgi:Pectate lyase superfamily protein